MKKANTILILILSILAAIITIGLFVLVLSVIDTTNKNTSNSLIIYQSKLIDKENAAIFYKKVNEIKLQQDIVNSHFVNPDKIDTFVSFLEGINNITNAEVSVKSIEVPASVKNTISFRLLIKGNFNQVMKSIAYLENVPYQINLTKVYLNKDIITSSDSIVSKTEKTIPKEKILQLPTWQADVSFNILSLK